MGLPILSILARWIFSIPQASAAAEKYSSGTGLTFSCHLVRLSDENLESIISVRSVENRQINDLDIKLLLLSKKLINKHHF